MFCLCFIFRLYKTQLKITQQYTHNLVKNNKIQSNKPKNFELQERKYKNNNVFNEQIDIIYNEQPKHINTIEDGINKVNIDDNKNQERKQTVSIAHSRNEGEFIKDILNNIDQIDNDDNSDNSQQLYNDIQDVISVGSASDVVSSNNDGL